MIEKAFPVVRVLWHDAQRISGLPDGSMIVNVGPVVTESVGFLIQQDDDCIVLAQSSYHANADFVGHISDPLMIPSGMVIEITTLPCVVTAIMAGGCDSKECGCGNC